MLYIVPYSSLDEQGDLVSVEIFYFKIFHTIALAVGHPITEEFLIKQHYSDKE